MTRRDWRRAKRLGFSDAQLGWLWNVDENEVRAARLRRGSTHHLQDGRHLWCGVRGRHAVPLLDLRGRGRGAAERSTEGGHPRIRSQSDRAGDRVRLLLRARELRASRRRVRDDHDQLQPGDRFDRLRHQRSSVLRTAHVRGRHERARSREAGGRHRESGWPDPAQAREHPSARVGPGHEPRVDRRGRGPRALERAVRTIGDPAAGRRHGEHGRGRAGCRRSRRLPGADATELCARRPGHGDRVRRGGSAAGHERAGRVRHARAGGRALGGATGARRSLPRRRDRGRRRRHPRSHRRLRRRWRHGARRRGRRAQR